jgi:hypothetical protein
LVVEACPRGDVCVESERGCTGRDVGKRKRCGDAWRGWEVDVGEDPECSIVVSYVDVSSD